KDWEDIKFGVDNKVDFYAVSFVKDAEVVHELKNYLKTCGADIHAIVKIVSAGSIPNLHSILNASDVMVARVDLGAELPIEEEEIINLCQSMGKVVIVITNMLESRIVHLTPTKAEVSDIAIVVREGSDEIMLLGERTHGKSSSLVRGWNFDLGIGMIIILEQYHMYISSNKSGELSQWDNRLIKWGHMNLLVLKIKQSKKSP
ncbi:Plastidial pyruvate kinase 2, partial [Mucuna pruriens]